MATSSIGTASRDYSTWTSWEAALGTGSQLGESYADSDFDEAVSIGQDLDPDDVTLTGASGERHDGTANTGVRNLLTAQRDGLYLDIHGSGVEHTISWIESDFNGNDLANDNDAGIFRISPANGKTGTISHCLGHGIDNASFQANGCKIEDDGISNCIRNIFYDIANTAGVRSAYGIFEDATDGQGTAVIRNDTVFNIKHNGDDDQRGVGISTIDNAGVSVQNNLVGDCGGTSSGTGECYDLTAPSNATYDHNIADDTTASGTGSSDSVDVAGEFVSTTGGSEDFHLVSGADAIGGATDFGDTPAGIKFDIDGLDLDAGGQTWDIGADQFVAAAVTTRPQLMMMGVG